MALTKLLFNPGINKESTDLIDKGGWVDGNLVRFRKGLPEKFGGWVKTTTEDYEGTGRALTAWVALDATRYLGLGTTFKYYVTTGDILNDITPIRSTDLNVTTFAATSGSAVITATDTGHGAVVNDFVTISNSSNLGSGGKITAAVLNQEHQITAVPTANTYTFTASATANGSDTGNGGSATDAAYQINVGLDVYVPSTGWGANNWGEGTFGSSTALNETGQLRLWSHDHFGENLIINPRNGGIYKWVENNGLTTRAVELSGISGANFVPTKAIQVITSEKDRHLIVLGADPIVGSARTGALDPMLIAFSDQENDLQFEPLITNTAGSLRLSSGSSIIGANKSRQEILVWTDTALYSMQFVGPPFTFAVNLINEGTGLIGPKASVTAPSAVFWMSQNNFYAYNGSVQSLPCSVQNYIFADINLTQSFKINAFTISEKSEIGWFYCSASSNEIDRYVIYNYAEQTWVYGSLSRTAWLDAGIESFPRAVSSGLLYQQETGFDDDGTPMTNVFIESSDFDIGDGEQFSFIRKIIPDFKFLSNSNAGKVNIVVKTRNFPGDSLTTRSTSSIGSTTQQSNIRARGRQAVLRFESDDDDTTANTSVGWRLGATRLDVKTDGKR